MIHPTREDEFPKSAQDCHEFDFFWQSGADRISFEDCQKIGNQIHSILSDLKHEKVQKDLSGIAKKISRVVKIPTFLGLANSTEKDEEYEFLKVQDKKLHSSVNCNPYHYQCKGFLSEDMNPDRLKILWHKFYKYFNFTIRQRFDSSHAKRTCQEYFLRNLCNQNGTYGERWNHSDSFQGI